jgi:hypothetical protein
MIVYRVKLIESAMKQTGLPNTGKRAIKNRNIRLLNEKFAYIQRRILLFCKCLRCKCNYYCYYKNLTTIYFIFYELVSEFFNFISFIKSKMALSLIILSEV